MKIRVVVTDDHALFRAGLVLLLRAVPDLEVVAELADGEETLESFRKLKPDVGVVDVQMPRMSGIELCRRAKELKLPTRTILLSMHRDARFVKAAMDAGALGYLVKEAAPRELVDAIHAVAGGDVYLSSRVAREALDAFRAPDQSSGEALSARERDVLRLLAQGLSSKEIAAKLDVSVRTVDGHRAQVIAKLGIHTVPGLVKYALKNHLADLDE